ncbi:MAG: DNA gyrase subunit A [Bdellovibrionales bacterium CG10_big_fil_rev_8_21_14_0_10_45_34]|nr:MAG: DNA gyrase subunit A [Bdellovibrionales bacterium CG10_big_fil_rev_8_21_14_0_10_45_34]
MDNTPIEPELGVTTVEIDKEMKEAYLQYSMSVIVGRALPDVRDGLKPVHRRVLYSMYEMGNNYNKPYKKSARVVGDVIGKYHPHGDTAVYDTIVRMAQEFSLRHPLVDGQGNFGSIDGDNPAAMRYTEIRMTKLAEQILEDLDKETVPFGPNYDDSLEVPLVLPSKFPNLLVNGSAGIAVGMATNIPPHNLGEVIDGCILLIDEPNASVSDLLQIIQGPDFPTAATIAGRRGIQEAYHTGRGIITLRAVAEIEPMKGDRENIIIKELPYQVNKAKLIESIADLVKDKRIEGISDIRDESSKLGIRVVIDIKRGENAGVILNNLYKLTQLQTSFGIIMLALDAHNRPKVFSLREMLSAFLTHRKDIVTKRCLFELRKAQDRIHLLEGLKVALSNIDEVVKIIRGSTDSESARNSLMTKFAMTLVQAQAILDMRLARLTGLERQKILDEIKELTERIDWLKTVLASQTEILKIIREELVEIKKTFANPRRTQISGDLEEFVMEDLVAKEETVVTVSNTGLIKRMSLDHYRIQNRGGRGLKGADIKEEDFASQIFVTHTHATLMIFTDKGKGYWLKVFRIPEVGRTAKGKSIANVVKLASTEKIKAILPIDDFRDDLFTVFLTRKGIIKKTALSAYSNIREKGIIAINVDLDDEIIATKLSNGENDIFIVTREGMSIRFPEQQCRGMGRTSRGVKAITLSQNDRVVGFEVLTKEDATPILMVTEKGYGKRTPANEYRTQSRGGVGIITQKITDRVGYLVGTSKVQDKDEIMVSTDKGQVIRIACSQISLVGRNTQGVRLMNVREGELVTGFALIAESGEEVTTDSNSSDVH